MGIKWVTRMFLPLCSLAVATTAWSAEIHGRSSTQFNFFNDEIRDRRQVDLSEYLNLSITKIDPAGKFSIFGYGRGTQDLNTGEGLSARLYYLYGDYRDLYDKVDIRLGRQFVNYAAGSAIIDGGEVTVKNVGPVAFSVMGGRDVIFGAESNELTHGGDFAMAMSAYLTGFRKTDAEIGWFRKYRSYDVAQDVLGASFKQYLFNSVRLYGNTRFDLVSETFNEVLAGVKYFPLANLVFTGEWYQSYPIFDTTSIYSVFAVERYQEALGRVDYQINDMIGVHGGYKRQYYAGDGAVGNVYNIGTTVRPIDPLQLNVEYDNRQGYGGSTNGIIFETIYDPTKQLQVAAGITYDVYQRDSMTNDEIARKYWMGAKYKLAKNMAASFRIEDNVNVRYKENVEGRFVFDYDF